MHARIVQVTAILLGLAGVVAVGFLISAQTAHKGQAVAEVGGEVITAQELEKALGAELASLQEQIHRMKKEKLEALIEEKLLAQEAAKRGLGVEALLEAEVNAKVEAVTDPEVETLVQANKDRFKGTEETLRERVRDFLKQRKLEARRRDYLESLRAAAEVAIHLPPPEIYRAEVDVAGAPARGAENAPVTLVKFEDFHCPYCDRVQATLAQLQSRYGDKLKIVHRDFPIDTLHPLARKAHEATRCAGAQGQFWAYHDLLYADKPATTVEELIADAENLGLDVKAFEECLNSGTYAAGVEEDIKQGTRLGLTGTPSFFVNGRLLSGALPLQEFVEVIEEELARTR